MQQDENGRHARSERVVAGHEAALAPLRQLADLIASSPHNLVSRSERTAVFDRHVLESVAVGHRIAPRPGSRWMDLGTGGGLPGLALAVCWPQVAWVLLDATGKKVEEVERFAEALGLANVVAVQARAEALHAAPGWRRSFDGVVSRAVARLPELAALAEPFLRDGGVLAAVKGPRWQAELEPRGAGALPPGLTLVSGTEVVSAVRPTWVVTMRRESPQDAVRRPRRAPRGRRGGAG